MQEDVGEEDDDLEPAVEERDVETFDDSEFYQQLLKEFLEGSAVGSGAGRSGSFCRRGERLFRKTPTLPTNA